MILCKFSQDTKYLMWVVGRRQTPFLWRIGSVKTGQVIGIDHAQVQIDLANEKARSANVAGRVTHQLDNAIFNCWSQTGIV